jgi:hypothetical protein
VGYQWRFGCLHDDGHFLDKERPEVICECGSDLREERDRLDCPGIGATLSYMYYFFGFHKASGE